MSAKRKLGRCNGANLSPISKSLRFRVEKYVAKSNGRKTNRRRKRQICGMKANIALFEGAILNLNIHRLILNMKDPNSIDELLWIIFRAQKEHIHGSLN